MGMSLCCQVLEDAACLQVEVVAGGHIYTGPLPSHSSNKSDALMWMESNRMDVHYGSAGS